MSAQDKLKNEILACMHRYSQESDITVLEAIQAAHQAAERIFQIGLDGKAAEMQVAETTYVKISAAMAMLHKGRRMARREWQETRNMMLYIWYQKPCEVKPNQVQDAETNRLALLLGGQVSVGASVRCMLNGESGFAIVDWKDCVEDHTADDWYEVSDAKVNEWLAR